MRFLANENFPGAAVKVLEAAGHDVVWVRITAPGTGDPDVLAWAIREERILLTFDKDFGELARASQLPTACGVVLFRMPMPKPGDAGQRLADLITARDDWAGHFSVVDPGRTPARSGQRAVRAPAASRRCRRASRRPDRARSSCRPRRPPRSTSPSATRRGRHTACVGT